MFGPIRDKKAACMVWGWTRVRVGPWGNLSPRFPYLEKQRFPCSFCRLAAWEAECRSRPIRSEKWLKLLKPHPLLSSTDFAGQTASQHEQPSCGAHAYNRVFRAVFLLILAVSSFPRLFQASYTHTTWAKKRKRKCHLFHTCCPAPT